MCSPAHCTGQRASSLHCEVSTPPRRAILPRCSRDLGAFVVVAVVVICTPGQDTALTSGTRSRAGGGAGIATAVGDRCGIAVWTLAASAGLVALLSASEPVFRALQLAGAGVPRLPRRCSRSLWALVGAPRTPRDVSARATRLTPRRALSPGAPQQPRQSRRSRSSSRACCRSSPRRAADRSLALLALGLLFCAHGARVALALRGRGRQGSRRFSADACAALDAVTGAVLVALGLRLAADER